MVTASIITNNGKRILLNRGYKPIPDYTPVSKFKVGINTVTVPSIVDNDLTQPVPITGTELIDGCDAITGWTPNLTNTVSVNTLIYYEGTGSLNLTKMDVTSALVSAYKATPTLNFTGKRLYVFVYLTPSIFTMLKSSGTALTVRFGSDSSNYYEYTRTLAQLSIGNNPINFTSAEATVVGTPVITTCVYTYISYETNNAGDTTVNGDFIMDDFKLASNGNYNQVYVVGYPSFDYVNNEVTIRAYIPSTDANGFNIDSFGLVNTDTSPLMSDIDVFPNESKSTTDEFVFIKKDRIL